MFSHNLVASPGGGIITLTKQEQQVVQAAPQGAGAPAYLFDGSIYMDKGRQVWIPPGFSGLEIVALANLICEETDLGSGGARVLAIRLLSELQRLRGA